MNKNVIDLKTFNQILDDSPMMRILAASLFLYNIPLLVIPNLEVRHLGMFDNEFKFVYMKQVYHITDLDEEMDQFLSEKWDEDPSNPIFPRQSKVFLIDVLKEMLNYSEYYTCYSGCYNNSSVKLNKTSDLDEGYILWITLEMVNNPSRFSAWTLHELFKDYSVHDRLLIDALLLYKIPLSQIHKLNEYNIGTFADGTNKIVIENQVYELNFLETDTKAYLGDLIVNAPGDNPIFTNSLGKRMSVRRLIAFHRKVTSILQKQVRITAKLSV